MPEVRAADAAAPLDWAALVARAATLAERLAAPPSPERRAPHPETAATWARTCARGDTAAFAQRLEALGLDPNDIATRLADPLPDPVLPPWATVLQHAMARLPNHVVITHDAPHPLAPLLDPLLAEVRARMADITLTPSAREDAIRLFESDLVTLLTTCTADRWPAWTHGLEVDAAAAVWDDYPALARLVGTTIIDGIERMRDLARWFADDRERIAETFAISAPILIGIDASGGDTHEGHARVLRCRVRDSDDREHLVYLKPRRLDGEVVWQRASASLHGHGIATAMLPSLIAADDHGWEMHAEHAPARTDADVQGSYSQAGATAALLFALGGNDLHGDNLVSTPTGLVLLDAETILSPTIGSEDGIEARSAHHVDCILDGFVLPRWVRLRDHAVDITVLAPTDPGASPLAQRLAWQRLDDGTWQVVREETQALGRQARILSPEGEPTEPSAHARIVLDSLSASLDALAHGIDEALIEPGTEVRVLVRSTATYWRILQTSMEPRLLTSGLHRSLHLEHLARAVLDRQDSARSLAFVDAERGALETGVIPRFTVAPDDHEIRYDDAALLPLAETAGERMRRRLFAIRDPRARDVQMDFARTAFAVTLPSTRRALIDGRAAESAADLAHVIAAIRPAVRRLRDIVVDALRLTPHDAAPYSLTAASPAAWAVEPMAAGLYDGSLGLAVALLAADRALSETNDGTRLLLHVATMQAVRHAHRLIVRHGTGGQDGIAGLVWGLALAHELAAPEQHADIEQAMTIAISACSGATVHANTDLLGGSAGLLGSILAATRCHVEVDQDFGRELTRAVARACLDSESRPGFAHGDPGCVAVLTATLSAPWHDPTTDDIVTTALGYLAARSRPPADHEGWCRGAVGDVVATRDTQAIARIAEHRWRDDTLCCGVSGAIEGLRAMAAHDPDARSVRDSLAAALASRVMRSSPRIGVPDDVRLVALGLFQGYAGPLYALAGCEDPTLPHPLTWGGSAGSREVQSQHSGEQL
ncbi:MAG: hypothetical protein B7C55_08690 [Actinomycetales bacterium mxb001]|nr:MAG: hypothetical protein B7C55_08690 [Actinomycetales bacterium mxb001]